MDTPQIRYVLRWGDSSGYDPAQPPTRPRYVVDARMPPPWLAMTDGEIASEIAATDAAWAAWEASRPPTGSPRPAPLELVSPDGSRWTITVSDAGALAGRRS